MFIIVFIFSKEKTNQLDNGEQSPFHKIYSSNNVIGTFVTKIFTSSYLMAGVICDQPDFPGGP